MSERFPGHVGLTFATLYKRLDDRLIEFEENFSPNNMSIPGTFAVTGNSTFSGSITLGNDDSDLLDINAQTTFHGEVNMDVANVNTLYVIDNLTVGDDDDDTMTINSATTFNNSVTFDGSFDVSGNATFGSDNYNTLIATGNIHSRNMIIGSVSSGTVSLNPDDSIKMGSAPTIVYTEYAANGNIYTDYPSSVIVVVKNTSNVNISITISDEDDSSIISGNSTQTFLKVSTSGFTRVI
jgi:hypothetical protein